jgi:hypothetical protein
MAVWHFPVPADFESNITQRATEAKKMNKKKGEGFPSPTACN